MGRGREKNPYQGQKKSSSFAASFFARITHHRMETTFYISTDKSLLDINLIWDFTGNLVSGRCPARNG
jgi:hypothetical protein